MVFNSLHFLAFFPLVTLVYFALPKRVQWVWMLVSSYYFYMCWNAKYVVLIAWSTLATYVCARILEKISIKSVRRAVLAAGLALNLCILGFFKYYGFFADTLSRLFGAVGVSLHIPAFDVLLPVGISFYTFQALGYMIDVYRGDIPAEKNLFRYALFVSFFPQLVAGPIERSRNLMRQVHESHSFDYKRVMDGLLIMMLGFFEKLIVADRASIYVDAVYSQWHQASGSQILLATVVFAFQIYGDFGGYSHIAIGAAKILGFDLMENFRQPYFACSVREFWRRWHISLSTWFRAYLYIPLGGSRCSGFRRGVNTIVTFAVSGLWHGAALNFIVWGTLNGVLQVAEGMLPAARKAEKGLRKALRMLCTFVVIDLTWLFFRANALGTALRMLMRVATKFTAAAAETGFSWAQGTVLFCGIACLLGIDALHERGVSLTELQDRLPMPVRGLLTLLGVLLLIVFGVWGSQYTAQAFIYFQF